MIACVQTIANALQTTGLKFAHFSWSHAPSGDWGVYAEDGEGTFFADRKRSEVRTEGSIDYFTHSDDGVAKAAIETALDGIDIVYWLNSVQYEDDTGFIHYEWRWHE